MLNFLHHNSTSNLHVSISVKPSTINGAWTHKPTSSMTHSKPLVAAAIPLTRPLLTFLHVLAKYQFIPKFAQVSSRYCAITRSTKALSMH
mmetsp:Transcript_2052/g.3263  ORF Transcript_2052/g.3263 Transcript_2052/m.3263 type:complete len:90 (-) Transcript_2052:805-1074(-)